MNCDFSGWATRNDLLCADGRTIRKNAFKGQDGQTVPLVWNHNHSAADNVLGHALLENRDEGVYAYCTFNDSAAGKAAKEAVRHGDVRSLSIMANRLKQSSDGDVLHGIIREVSLVLAGANPGAFIDNVMIHGEISDEDIIVGYDENIMLHSSDEREKEDGNVVKNENEETVQDVFDTLTEKQKTVVYAIIGQALSEQEESVEDNNDTSKGGDNTMKHNIFDNEERKNANVLSHAEMTEIIRDAKRCGSLKESMLEHGIEQIDYLFPDAKTITNTPDFIQRDMDWVRKVMNGVHRTPFSRVKSLHADITEDEARAKGYIKGKIKKDEAFTLLKRSTTPTTIYKKQKLDRDDIIDITDFDVVSWLKSEMRLMLDEEIARAILVGDGRLSSSDDKINEQNIRPIWTDSDLYTIKQPISVTASTSEEEKAREFIKGVIKSRKNYRGSGTPSLYVSEDMLTTCLLLTDSTGRDIYDSVEKLATKLRVKEIITIPIMENLTRNDTSASKNYSLAGIIVNLNDYNIGADKGGAVNMFDDFDIDYNAQKYLIETRCSGALVKPYSAIAIEFETSTVGG